MGVNFWVVWFAVGVAYIRREYVWEQIVDFTWSILAHRSAEMEQIAVIVAQQGDGMEEVLLQENQHDPNYWWDASVIYFSFSNLTLIESDCAHISTHPAKSGQSNIVTMLLPKFQKCYFCLLLIGWNPFFLNLSFLYLEYSLFFTITIFLKRSMEIYQYGNH